MQHLKDSNKEKKKSKVSIGKAFKTIIWPRRNLVFIGLILILTLGLTIYGLAAFGQEKSQNSDNDLQTKKAWDQFKGGFFVGACGSAGFAFICLSSIPTFIIS